MKFFKKYQWIILGVASIAFLIVMPKLITNQYLRTVLCNGLIFAIAVYGLNVMLGMGGQVTFSTAGMMGVGAFVTAIFTVKLGIHPLIALACSLAITGVFAFLVGFALLKLKGNYFAFASIALTQVLYVVMLNWKPVTGGADGITGIPSFSLGFYTLEQTDKLGYFYIAFAFALICGFIVYRIRKSSLGRSLASIRDNEIAANCLGVNVFRTRIISFVIAGMFAALAGSLYAHLNAYISAESFNFDQSGIYLVMAMLGGISSTVGSFVGAVLLTLLPEFMRGLQTYYKFIYGVGVIVIMIFMPMGFAGIVKSIFTKISHKKNKLATAQESEAQADESHS